MMISYAQNREDALLSRAFGQQTKGFYIDVGANHPIHDSVTKHFYEQGWHGINIEPGKPFGELAADRHRDINLNVAVSNRIGKATFYEFASTGLSTMCGAEAQARIKEGRAPTQRDVESLTLAAICEAHVQGEIDFISIDVEGHEREVIEGGDWRRWRPRVAVIESTRPNSTEASHEPWEPILLSAGYWFAVFDGLNRFYVRDEDQPLLAPLRRPLTVLDHVVPYGVQRLQARIEELEAALRDVKRTHPIGYLVGRAVYHSRRWLSRGVWAHSKLPGSGAAHRLNSNKQSQSLTDVL